MLEFRIFHYAQTRRLIDRAVDKELPFACALDGEQLLVIVAGVLSRDKTQITLKGAAMPTL